MKTERKTISLLVGAVNTYFSQKLIIGFEEEVKRQDVNALYFLGVQNEYLYESVLNIKGTDYNINTNMVAKFNILNLLAVISSLVETGYDINDIIPLLNDINTAPGRCMHINEGQDFNVIVDYAHTPDGLENVLNTARAITKGKLWVVFGCGGDRDAKKRPIMGGLALELADNIVVTSDNPRSEDPEKILDDICVAFKDVPVQKSLTRIADRKEAIEFALKNAEAEDVILIAGKGHENYQILKNETIHFDDREVVIEYWRSK